MDKISLENVPKVLPFLKEEEIVQMLEVIKFDKKACEDAFPFLESESVILYVACRCPDDLKVWQDVAKRLNFRKKPDRELFAIVKEGGFATAICSVVAKYLKSDATLMEILSSYAYRTTVCLSGIARLKNNDNVIKVIRDANDRQVTLAGIKRLGLKKKSQQEIIDFLEKTGYRADVCEGVIPYIESEETIYDLIRKARFDDNVRLVAISHLNSTELIIKTMGVSGYITSACKIGAKRLNLKSMTENEIFQIIKNTEYNVFVCREAIRVLKLNKMTDTCILRLMEKADFRVSFCHQAIPYLKSEKNILQAIEKNADKGYDRHLYLAGLRRIKDQAEIIKIVLNNESDEEVSRLAFNRLKMENKTEKEIMDTLAAVNYNIFFCSTAIPLLKSTANVFQLLAETNFEESVANSVVDWIDDINL